MTSPYHSARCETIPWDHLRDNIIHRSYFNNAAGINSNGKMVFAERLERTVYVPILTLTAAVINISKKISGQVVRQVQRSMRR
jgi:hypothetical protein